MKHNWYELAIDETLVNPWFLLEPMRDSDLDPLAFRELTLGKRVDLNNFVGYRVAVGRVGEPLDFTIGAFNISVVSEKVADILKDVVGDDVQLLPVNVSPLENDLQYYIVIICKEVACFDWQNSKFDAAPEGPRKLRMVGDWKICPQAVPDGIHIFYVAEWPAAMIVSSALMLRLIQAGVSGVVYLPRG